jgi:hypothetical protein
MLHVPDLNKTLISVNKMNDDGFCISFETSGKVLMTDKKSHQQWHIGQREGNVYYLKESPEQMGETMEQALLTYEIWHERLAHVGKTRFKALQMITDIADLKGIMVPKDKKCKGCILGKQSRKTFPSSKEMKFEPGECVSSDLQGPFEVQTINGKRYFLGFTDKNSGYVKAYFTRTKTKEEIASILEDFISHNKALTGRDLKVWQTDGGGEFLNESTNAILKKHNIVRRVTNTDTPEG